MAHVTDVPDAIVESALAPYAREAYLAGALIEGAARVIRRVLETAAPAMAEHVAARILAHMEEHGPRDAAGEPLDSLTGMAWRRHLRTAAQVASLAFSTEEDIKREAAEALSRGDYTACFLDDAGKSVAGERED